jgi:prepilin-type N-terminal cleavage/methylation domain-containing protein
MRKYEFRGFTLIELLIVVAIIAILAAIAVPNFLEAQVRSKVSRVKADMRSLATALEAYAVDTNHYPVGWADPDPEYFGRWPISLVVELTTPVAYITSVGFEDPFYGTKGLTDTGHKRSPLYYFSYEMYSVTNPPGLTTPPAGGWGNWMWLAHHDAHPGMECYKGYCLLSYGPDRAHNGAEWSVWDDLPSYETDPDWPFRCNLVYDPTNGTVSRGDIIRYGGAVPGFLTSGR